jgi:arylsulfatase A-like enzyme
MIQPLLILALAAFALHAARRPNVVFLLSDDQSTYSMGCYGNPDVKTPNLDRLGADGMIFDCHYDTTAICMASRASVFTGLFEYRHGCNFEHGDLTADKWANSYPVLLRKAGYQTAFAGKYGILVAPDPDSKGAMPESDFDRWGGGPGQTSYDTAKNKSMREYAKEFPHSTLSYGAFGRDFIRDAAKRDAPFCLSISFKAPHMPDTPDPRFDDIYRGKIFTKPDNYGREHGEHFSEQSRQGRQFERFHSWKYADQYDQVMATYNQQIYAIDQAVGMIRKALEEAGVAKNTVIIYTSDNGFLCGSHGYGSKVLPYEEASRVPLIVFDPRKPNSGKGLRCKALTGNVDFAPTILELAGVAAPADLDGKSLATLYEDPRGEIHRSLPLINVWGPAEVHSLGVVTRDAKYVLWNYAEGKFSETEELYDLANDRAELENKATHSDHRSTLLELRKRYDSYVADWKRRGVRYNHYEKFATIFDRNASWDTRRPLVLEKKRKN